MPAQGKQAKQGSMSMYLYIDIVILSVAAIAAIACIVHVVASERKAAPHDCMRQFRAVQAAKANARKAAKS